MKRINAKELLPVIKDFTEEKQIQFFNGGAWINLDYPNFSEEPSLYRIKPEQKYRPFKSVEECWAEMQKHQPFGWVKNKTSTQMYRVCDITESTDWDYRFSTFMFIDGTPYGIKEE